MYGCTKIGNFQSTCIFPGGYLHTSLTIQCTVTDYRHHLSWKQYNIRLINCGRQEAPTILITGLLLHMHGTYVASFVFPVPSSEIVRSAELRKRENEKKRVETNPPRQLFAYLSLSHLPHYLRAWNRLALFGLPLRMNQVHRTQSDHACLDLLSLIIWSSAFGSNAGIK